MAKVGVEQSLTAVQEELRNKGYDVVSLQKEEDSNDCDCCVVSGQDVNVMGIQNAETEGPVIDARGLSADQVCQEVEDRIK